MVQIQLGKHPVCTKDPGFPWNRRKEHAEEDPESNAAASGKHGHNLLSYTGAPDGQSRRQGRDAGAAAGDRDHVRPLARPRAAHIE